VIETSPKWHDVAEMNIEQGDSIQNSYEGELDGKMGYLLLSKRKLLFVREEGFLRKSYDLSLDLPYANIEEFSLHGRFELKMTDVEGRKHGFRSFEVLAQRIEERLENLSSI
jgi:hypothetical protein